MDAQRLISGRLSKLKGWLITHSVSESIGHGQRRDKVVYSPVVRHSSAHALALYVRFSLDNRKRARSNCH